MFEIQNYISFLVAILVFQIIPGAGTLAILNATARNGVAVGFSAVIGTLLGDFIYMVASIIGLGAVMKANPLLFQGFQWLGAAYLCWIGLRLSRAPIAEVGAVQVTRRSSWLYFRQALAVSLTNPKVVLFFMAFFPLFLRVDSSFVTLIAMMAHVTVLSFFYQAGLVLVGNIVARKLSALPWARKIAIRLAGFALIGFGFKLALNNR